MEHSLYIWYILIFKQTTICRNTWVPDLSFPTVLTSNVSRHPNRTHFPNIKEQRPFLQTFCQTCLVTPVDNEGQLWYLKAKERPRFFWERKSMPFLNKPISNQLIEKRHGSTTTNPCQSSTVLSYILGVGGADFRSIPHQFTMPIYIFIYICICIYIYIYHRSQGDCGDPPKRLAPNHPPFFKTGLTHVPPQFGPKYSIEYNLVERLTTTLRQEQWGENKFRMSWRWPT